MSGQNPDGKNTVDKHTELNYASRIGDVTWAKSALERGADPNHSVDGCTALHWAAKRGNSKLCTILLEKGAFPDARDQFGASPLAWAAGSGRLEACKVLLGHGADVMSTDGIGRGVLHHACSKQGNVDTLQLLVDYGADHRQKDDEMGMTPLHEAAYCGKADLVQYLLFRGAEGDVLTRDGRTPRQIAQSRLNMKAAHALAKWMDGDKAPPLTRQQKRLEKKKNKMKAPMPEGPVLKASSEFDLMRHGSADNLRNAKGKKKANPPGLSTDMRAGSAESLWHRRIQSNVDEKGDSEDVAMYSRPHTTSKRFSMGGGSTSRPPFASTASPLADRPSSKSRAGAASSLPSTPVTQSPSGLNLLMTESPSRPVPISSNAKAANTNVASAKSAKQMGLHLSQYSQNDGESVSTYYGDSKMKASWLPSPMLKTEKGNFGPNRQGEEGATKVYPTVATGKNNQVAKPPKPNALISLSVGQDSPPKGEMMTNDVIRSGFLLKKSKHRVWKWNMRYFFICSGHFDYYRSNEDMEPKLHIDARQCRCQQLGSSANRFLFKVVSKQKIFVLSDTTSTGRNAWIDAIDEAKKWWGDYDEPETPAGAAEGETSMDSPRSNVSRSPKLSPKSRKSSTSLLSSSGSKEYREVEDILRRTNMKQHMRKFKTAEIRDSALPHIDENVLKEAGVPPGAAIIIMTEVRERISGMSAQGSSGRVGELGNGEKVGGYTVIKVLGRGGQGQVYQVKDRRNMICALKQIRCDDVQAVNHANDEAVSLYRLEHPYVLRVMKSFIHQVNECYYVNIVTEYCEGTSLKAYLASLTHRPLETEVLVWTKQLASALDHCHKKGILHRDLKSLNVLMTQRAVKLGDFGLARLLRDSDQKAVGGTIAYWAPELVQGEDFSAATDVWALGCIVLEMLLQLPLYSISPYMYQRVEKHRKKAVPKLLEERGMKKMWSKELVDVVVSLLSYDPKERMSLEGVLACDMLNKAPEQSVTNDLKYAQTELRQLSSGSRSATGKGQGEYSEMVSSLIKMNPKQAESVVDAMDVGDKTKALGEILNELKRLGLQMNYVEKQLEGT